MIKKGIYWLTTDLRLDDNQALMRAAQEMDELSFIYCAQAPLRIRKFQVGQSISTNRQRFINDSLKDLQAQLEPMGQHIVICEQPQQSLSDIISDNQITHIYRSADQHCLDNQIWDILKAEHQHTQFIEVGDNRLLLPSQLPFDIENLPNSFSKFRRKVETLDIFPPQSKVVFLPRATLAPQLWPATFQSFANSCDTDFIGGETAGLLHIQQYFHNKLASSYKETRNGLEGMDYSTKFSPWLAHGCVSVRRIIQTLRQYEADVIANDSTYWIFFELLWREYFYWYAEKYQDQMIFFSGIKERTPTTSFYPERFKKWCQGTTPFPIVNACMRQLNATGYMSNRGRQLVASCFVHELSLDWRYGAAYMEQQLLDFDLGSNWGNWQYLAGVGADPRGHRQFDLAKQTQTYDPKHEFINRWHEHYDNLPLDSSDPSDWPIDLQPTEITA